MQRQTDVAFGSSGFVDPIEQEPRRRHTHLVLGDMNRCESRIQLVDEEHVVEPNERDLSGCVDAGLRQCLETADRDEVVGCEDGGEVDATVEELATRLGAGLELNWVATVTSCVC